MSEDESARPLNDDEIVAYNDINNRLMKEAYEEDAIPEDEHKWIAIPVDELTALRAELEAVKAERDNWKSIANTYSSCLDAVEDAVSPWFEDDTLASVKHVVADHDALKAERNDALNALERIVFRAFEVKHDTYTWDDFDTIRWIARRALSGITQRIVDRKNSTLSKGQPYVG